MSERCDWRNIATGYPIPNENYVDQPYVVTADDGAWVCVLTTGSGREGHSGQHVVSTRSTDHGQTWSEPMDIEPPGPPESSWVMPVKVPSGRIYAFYVHNTDDFRQVISDSGLIERVDTLGHYMFKYSDDHGRTWSGERYEIPVRMTQIDRQNPYHGKLRFFWGVGKPIIHQGKVYFGFAKVGRFGYGFMAISEGYFLCSEDMCTERDPAKIRWQLLPDGEAGLRSVEGPVADEHNLVGLSDGSLYCTYRTIEGHNCAAYSRDGGHTWDGPQYASYSPGGRLVKHPRAANFVWRCRNGNYLLWFHNNGTKWYNNGPTAGNRNVAWLSGGVEREGYIHWSQPEIVMYVDNHFQGPSYPSLIEQDGRYWLTATQKTDARVVELPATFLEDMWGQGQLRAVAQDGLVLDLFAGQCEAGASVRAPLFPTLSGSFRKRDVPLGGRGGFAIDLWVRFSDLAPGQILLDGRSAAGKGIALTTTDRGTVRLEMGDGWSGACWECDGGLLSPGQDHHIVAIVDGGPKIISFVVDGLLCDGGEERPFGWGRFNPSFRDVKGARKWRIAPHLNGRIVHLRAYDRYLRTSEAIGNYRAGI